MHNGLRYMSNGKFKRIKQEMFSHQFTFRLWAVAPDPLPPAPEPILCDICQEPATDNAVNDFTKSLLFISAASLGVLVNFETIYLFDFQFHLH